MGRIFYKNCLALEKDVWGIVKSTAQALATLNRGIFDVYPER